MPKTRGALLLIAVCVAGGCDDVEARQAGQGDAGENDAEQSRPEHEAEPADAATDAADSEHDAKATATLDATPSEADDADAEDSNVTAPEAGTPCAVEAGVDSSCVAYLCESDGGRALALEQDQPWRIGALDWTATVCGRSLGWPAAATSDARQLVYSPTSADVQNIHSGAPVQVYYGGPEPGPSNHARLDCTVELRDPPPACRAMR